MFPFYFVISAIREFIWGVPLLLLIVGTGCYLTVLLRGIQFRYLFFGLRQLFSRKVSCQQGDITPFEALMTTLAGAIGTGAIVGVSTAIAIGGVGALFWMWITAFLGMTIKYAESLLAVKYRKKDKREEMVGGPMEYMEQGLKSRGMATIFALLGVIAALGTGNLVQVNSIAHAADTVWSFDPWLTGLILAITVGLVIVGGVKSIGQIAAILVPLMSAFYLFAGCLILLLHLDQIPSAFACIFSSAFKGQSAVGGFAGASVLSALQMGVSRGVLSNEAGLGLSSIASASAQTDSPARQALLTMSGTFFSTLIVCTITGLVIAVTNVLGTKDASGKVLDGAAMAISAFSSIHFFGKYIVSIGLILFAFSTVIAWSFYGEKCFVYLFGEGKEILYRVLFTFLIIPAAVLDLRTVWALADITNGLMAIPNLIALIGLSKVIVSETDFFFNRGSFASSLIING